MRLTNSSITAHPSRGKMTLQVPDVPIWFSDQNEPEWVDYPDEWFCTIRGSGQRFAVGREDGYTFLTRAGWNANKQKIKAAFESATWREGTWEDFERVAEDHFQAVARANAKYKAELEKKLKQLNDAIV